MSLTWSRSKQDHSITIYVAFNGFIFKTTESTLRRCMIYCFWSSTTSTIGSEHFSQCSLLSFSLSLSLSLFVYHSLSLSLFVCLCLSLCLSLYVCRSLCLSLSLSVCLLHCLILSLSLSFFLPLSLSESVSLYLPVSVSIELHNDTWSLYALQKLDNVCLFNLYHYQFITTLCAYCSATEPYNSRHKIS